MPLRLRILPILAATLFLTASTALAPAHAESVPRFTDPLAMYDASSVKVSVAADSSSVEYSVSSFEGVTVASGSTTVSGGAGSVDLGGLGPGYYELTVSNTAGKASTSLGIVAGAPAQPASSLFGTTAHPAIHPWIDQSAAAGRLGLRSVRVDWRWEDAVRADGSFAWDPSTEAEISRLQARGIRPTLVLAYYGLCDDGQTPSSKRCINQYADFVKATAQKYGASVDYGIYNEFNYVYNTGKCGRTADCYVKLLKPAFDAVRSYAPGAKVSGPALGAADDWWAVGGEAYNWFKRFVELGGHHYVDEATIHNYSLSTAPEGCGERAVANAKALLAAAGSTKPVVLEETGYNTVEGGQPESIQAAFLVRDAAAVLAAGAGRYMHYGLVNNWNAPSDPESNFGLFRHEDSSGGRLAPKPAAVAQAVLAKFLDGAVPAGQESLDPDVRSTLFRLPDGRTARIVWSQSSAHTLFLSGAGTLDARDLFGRQIPGYAEGDTVSIGISGYPVLLLSATPGTAAVS
ncbi:hypothetical protein BIU82_09415 [Arthrobacter sp. SW1]|uniref:hypothetical protein n=1 Tax=Arthrobacter sp. SW1 TaxID=1920889 RepID=UPI000877BAE8|nr:hypothetical protein [Arthrobacter sp. SW1]OFI37292.1 hypothetical protein BIU82_09415 [Arthrobacter sp. SW1]